MAKVEVTMPQMGESITEGTVITWHKKPGDVIEQDETLLEIGTDKVDTDVPSPEAGVLAEILVEEGATVGVGTVIAVIETDAEEAAVVAGPGTVHKAAIAPPTNRGGDGADAAGGAGDAVSEATREVHSVEVVEVVMPKMGESIIEGTILVWHKQPGEMIELDETLVEIATDKVDTDVPSPAAGIVQELLAAEGATVEVGTVIARIGGSAVVARAAPRKEAVQEKVVAGAVTEAAPSGDGAPVDRSGSGSDVIQRTGADGRFFSPLVRSIAEKEGLSMADLERIAGTGHSGRVTKKDLMDHLARSSAPASRAVASSTAPAGSAASPVVSSGGRTEIIQMDRMRQIIAQHMVDSKRTSAHVTSFAEVDVTGLVRLREARKAEFLEQEGVKLTFTPFFVQAAVEALRDHTLLNSSVDGTQIIVRKDIHVGIAVAIGKSGLVVPVIRNAGDMNVAGLARAAASLAERARSKQLQPDDLQGGTFTVTNIGSLGSLMGTPIIPQPQVAILATGTIKKRPVVIEDPQAGDVIAIRQMMYVSLSYDHRIIDGALASSFLHRLIEELESYTQDTEL